MCSGFVPFYVYGYGCIYDYSMSMAMYTDVSLAMYTATYTATFVAMVYNIWLHYSVMGGGY